jgi:hypothetical protein
VPSAPPAPSATSTQPPAPTPTSRPPPIGTTQQNGATWNFKAEVTATGTEVFDFTWDLGDGSGAIVTPGNTTDHVYTGGVAANGIKIVTVRTTDGRSATGRTVIVVSGLVN